MKKYTLAALAAVLGFLLLFTAAMLLSEDKQIEVTAKVISPDDAGIIRELKTGYSEIRIINENEQFVLEEE